MKAIHATSVGEAWLRHPARNFPAATIRSGDRACNNFMDRAQRLRTPARTYLRGQMRVTEIVPGFPRLASWASAPARSGPTMGQA
jgi:hypothetical protein